MINRAAILLKPKKPMLDWILSVDAESPDSPTLEEIDQEKTLYLIPEEDAETPKQLEKWKKLNFKTLFENALAEWYFDESAWPKRTYSLFTEWFEVECFPIIEDLVEAPISEKD